MRDYGKVHTSFWASETLRDLDADAKLLALYLLTSQHTHMAGAFRLPSAYACDDLKWTSERLANGFKTLSDAGWLRRCARTEWVQIVNFGRFNPPDNPNQRKAIEKQLASIPANCSLHETVSEGFAKGYGNGCLDSNNTPTPTPVPTTAPVPVVAIPLDDGTDHPVTPADIAEFRAAYPRIDPEAECRKARAWCIGNPANRKTRRGIGKFLNSWMARAQKDAESKPGAAPAKRRQML